MTQRGNGRRKRKGFTMSGWEEALLARLALSDGCSEAAVIRRLVLAEGHRRWGQVEAVAWEPETANIFNNR